MGGAATLLTVTEKFLLFLGLVDFVKNCDFFVKEEKRNGFGGLFLGEESVVVVAKAEIVCDSAINGVFIFIVLSFEMLIVDVFNFHFSPSYVVHLFVWCWFTAGESRSMVD